jgi:uncharacterized DUF497 family protein
MQISFDPAKRDKTLRERGLDFSDALEVFEGRSLTSVNDRHDDGETRYVTYGWLANEAVAVVWTERDAGVRVISMRRMHQWEIEHVGLD